MLDDNSVKPMVASGSITPPQRQRYTVITSPITPVTPPRDGGGFSDFFEGAPAPSVQEGFVDYWLLVGSGPRGDRVRDAQAPSSDDARLAEPATSSGGRDGKSCRTDPVSSAKKLPVKRKLCLSSDESTHKSADSSLVEKTLSRDSSNKRTCKENVDPSKAVTPPAQTLSQNYNENKDVCLAQLISVPVTRETASVAPTVCRISEGGDDRRGFQPYVPLSLHSAVYGQAGVRSYPKGGSQEKSNPHNVDRVIPEMFHSNSTTNDPSRFFDYSSFYNGSFYPYQTGTWNPYSVYNPTRLTSGLAQGSQHTPMYSHLYNATYQMTSTSGCTVPSQNYGSALYTQSHVNGALLPELSQFMSTGGHFKGNVQQSNPSFAAGAQGYQNPYYPTYAGSGSNDTSKYQN